jgi:hypothetical protein
VNGPAFARLLASQPEFASDYVWARQQTLDKVARLYEEATGEMREELSSLRNIAECNRKHSTCDCDQSMGMPSQPATCVDQADGAGDERA